MSSTPGPSYSAPSDGVITSWSFQAPATGTALLKFKVGRLMKLKLQEIAKAHAAARGADGQAAPVPVAAPAKA